MNKYTFEWNYNMGGFVTITADDEEQAEAKLQEMFSCGELQEETDGRGGLYWEEVI